MADALISVVVQQLAPFLLDKLKKEVNLVLGAPEDVEELLDTFRKISYVLDDAEKRYIHNVLHNMEKGETKEALEGAWLEKLKEVSFQMEDVLDEWHTELIKLEIDTASNGADAVGKGKKKVDATDKGKWKAWSCFTSPRSSIKKGTLHHKIGSRILELKQRLDLLMIEKDKYKFKKTKIDEERHRRLEEDRRDTGSMIKVAEVCGRDLEKEKLENMLLCESSHVEPSVRVISLIGMGGIGKTTLAQYIYNQENVVKHFEKKMWVCVSDPFDLKKIAKEIIKEVSGHIPIDTESWEALSKLLSKSIEGKIFLLVLDDVWTEDRTSWERLKLALDFGKDGSKIIVTTRDDAVADAVGTIASDKHMIGKLSDKDCWWLFERLAFKGIEEFECQRLKGIGRNISDKCKGVPLHAKLLGSLMPTMKTTEKEWEKVLTSDIWDLPLVSKGVLPALLLSYNALPSHLKRCFTYCAVFAKDTKIKKDTLIKLWMAEGCLRSTESSELESIGEKYFTQLVMRSFFQELKLDKYGDIRTCKMHDLLHDLATFLDNNEYQVAEWKDIKLDNTKLRHLYVQSYGDEMDGSLNSIWRLKSLRTLLAGRRYYGGSELQDWAQMSNLTCLRTLDLSGARISELPKQVEKLIHVRYLNLSYCEKIKEVPETITNLCNLQTLDLSYCSSLGGLPNSFGKLVSLRHLGIKGCCFTKGLPRGIGKLRELRILSDFIVSEEGCDLGELKDLNNLRGSLIIKNIRGIGNEAQEVMNNKIFLQNLGLWFSSESVDDDSKVLELLEPHSDLKELGILGYSGSKFPSWMEFQGTREKPIMLRGLEIMWCSKLKVLPTLAELQFLEYLKLEGLKSVAPMGLEVVGDAVGVSVEMSASNIAFPKLKELVICDMNWEEWVIDTRSTNITLMPCLQTLFLGNCPVLKSLPWQLLSSSSLRKLNMGKCPNLVVSRLPLSLEELTLGGDTGSLSKSLPVEGGPHTNLKHLVIMCSKQSTLPEGVSQLTALQTLEIWGSPILAARCKKGEGEEWNIISHIPNIHIWDE